MCINRSQTAGEKELASARRIASLEAERGWTPVSEFGSEIGKVVVEEPLRRRGRTVAISESVINNQVFENSNSLKSAVETAGLHLTGSWPGSSATEHPLQVGAGISVSYADVAIVTAEPKDYFSREQVQNALLYGRPLIFIASPGERTKPLGKMCGESPGLVEVAFNEDQAVSQAIARSVLSFVSNLLW